jgi:predicted HTH transcriptional regulator
MLPKISWDLRIGELFPLPEGQQIEFKENNTQKLDATLCGFLNTAGGYYITGIADSGRIVGLSRSMVDVILQKVDNTIRNGKILNVSTGNPVGVKEISTSVVPVDSELYLVVIRAETTNTEHVFQTESGVWYRLNASNTRCRSEFEDIVRIRDRLIAEKNEMLRDISVMSRDLRSSVVAYTETLAALHSRILAEKEEAERRMAKQRGGVCGLTFFVLT